MKILNILKTFKVFFRLILIFLFVFVWCRYYIYNLWLSLLVSAIITFIIEFVFNIILNKKNKNKNIKQSELNDILSYTNSFIYNEKTKTTDFFLNLVKTKYLATKHNDLIIIDHISTKVILHPNFMYRDFTADDLIDTYNKAKKFNPTKIIICTNNIDNSTQKIINQLPIKTIVLDYQQTYLQLLKPYNVFPEKTELTPTPKQTLKQLVYYALNKKRTKGYFFTSVLLLLCSFTVPYKLYYVIMSSILLLLSYFSFVNLKFNKQSLTDILEIS